MKAFDKENLELSLRVEKEQACAFLSQPLG